MTLESKFRGIKGSKCHSWISLRTAVHLLQQIILPVCRLMQQIIKQQNQRQNTIAPDCRGWGVIIYFSFHPWSISDKEMKSYWESYAYQKKKERKGKAWSADQRKSSRLAYAWARLLFFFVAHTWPPEQGAYTYACKAWKFQALKPRNK
jgi:hypothetical protein